MRIIGRSLVAAEVESGVVGAVSAFVVLCVVRFVAAGVVGCGASR